MSRLTSGSQPHRRELVEYLVIVPKQVQILSLLGMNCASSNTV